MKRTFYYNERRKQSNLYKTGFFGSARNGGLWTILDDDGNKTGVATDLDFILVPDDSKENMFAPIRQDALDYFNRYDISWWRQDEDWLDKGAIASSPRAMEIEAWLHEHDNVDNFVILDDMPMSASLQPHFVQINPTLGLLRAQAEKAVEILNTK